MKAVPIKIVILVACALIVVFGVWISVGAKVGSMDEYPAINRESDACEAALSKVKTLDFSCNSQSSSFNIMNDYLSLMEKDSLLSGDTLKVAWGGFRDSYMNDYLNCKIDHFRNARWYGNEIINVIQHLSFWKQRCSLANFSQVGTIEGIWTGYNNYPKKKGEYRSEKQADDVIAQMKRFTENAYLQNCVTLQNNLEYLQKTMGDSHIEIVLSKKDFYRDPDAYFEEESEFDDDVNSATTVLLNYKGASREGRYGRSHPDYNKEQIATEIVNGAIWP